MPINDPNGQASWESLSNIHLAQNVAQGTILPNIVTAGVSASDVDTTHNPQHLIQAIHAWNQLNPHPQNLFWDQAHLAQLHPPGLVSMESQQMSFMETGGVTAEKPIKRSSPSRTKTKKLFVIKQGTFTKAQKASTQIMVTKKVVMPFLVGESPL